VLVREPRPGAYHGRTQARLSQKLGEFVESGTIAGVVFTDVGVVLSRRLRTVRGPDVAFYRPDRLPDPLPPGFLDAAPDLAVEVVSASDSASEILEKVMEYLDAGSRAVWVIDPRSRTATVYRSREVIRILGDEDVLDGEDVIPGFRLPLRDILP
jgi:Uma2 family endonuclease